MTEKIGVSFDKRVTSEDPISYLVKTNINSTITDPSYLDTCLLVSPGDETHEEVLSRIAILSDLTPTEIYPVLPDVVNKFSCAAYDTGSVLPGYPLFIRASSYPKSWSMYFGVTGDLELEVVNVIEGIVTVTPGVPTFARNLTFSFAEYGEDSVAGVINRNYTGESTYYRAASHVDVYTTANAATTAIAARKVEFSNLVKETKDIGFAGVDIQLYE